MEDIQFLPAVCVRQPHPFSGGGGGEGIVYSLPGYIFVFVIWKSITLSVGNSIFGILWAETQCCVC